MAAFRSSSSLSRIIISSSSRNSLRQSLSSSLSRSQYPSHSILLHKYSTSSQESAQKPIPQSSVPAGTVLKGINILKDGKDPVALKDEEYPPWLWEMVTERKTKFDDEEKLTREYLKFANKEKIRMNTLKKMSGKL